MAKSKNGGTRSMIRGRVGSDVYSVGKDGKGQRQQVVRSLAESVANPRTESQMFGRMIMSTVMQAVSGLKPIIDHSFDGVPKGQPSISEFIRRNYALIKADAIANPSSNNNFGLLKYQEKGLRNGAFEVAAGSAVKPAAVSASDGVLVISLPQDNVTVGALKAALGLTVDGYLTYVGINFAARQAIYCRVKLDTSLADTTAITANNVASLFSFEGNVTPSVELDSYLINIQCHGSFTNGNEGVIVSDKVDGQWIHNNVKLTAYAGVSFAADVALPTYPTGSEMYLNGGGL